jgi:hypothetical protein
MENVLIELGSLPASYQLLHLSVLSCPSRSWSYTHHLIQNKKNNNPEFEMKSL